MKKVLFVLLSLVFFQCTASAAVSAPEKIESISTVSMVAGPAPQKPSTGGVPGGSGGTITVPDPFSWSNWKTYFGILADTWRHAFLTTKY